jgi:hypothetical protein
MTAPLSYRTDVLAHLGHPAPGPGDRVFGIEIELEPRGSFKQVDLMRALGGTEDHRTIVKSDGSLQNGVELVSLPATLAGHSDGYWSKRLRPLAAMAKAGAGTTNCGIHVHCNLSNISTLTLGKMLVLVNSPANAPFIERIAQRAGSYYARPFPKKLADGAATFAPEGRYQALNVTRNTVEFRIFRSSIRADRVLKCLEACDAIIAYCEATSIDSIGRDTATATGSGEAITRFIMDRRHLWPHLAEFLTATATGGPA